MTEQIQELTIDFWPIIRLVKLTMGVIPMDLRPVEM